MTRQFDDENDDLEALTRPAPAGDKRRSAPGPFPLRGPGGNQAAQRLLGGGVAPREGTAVGALQRQAEGDAAGGAEPVAGLLVEDTATTVGPGQMRKGEYLAALKAAVTQTAEAGLEGTIWSTVGCPYIERWFAYYSGQSAEHITQAVYRFVPATRGATSAADTIPLITARVQAGMNEWLSAGQLPGAAEGEGAEGGGRPPGILGRLAGLFRQSDGGEAPPGADAARVSEQLQGGQPLAGGTRQRLQRGFGTALPEVRVHTDNQAAALNKQLRARAFTVGNNIAFGAGQYRPGTPIGDALIAHEMAHVLQQQLGGPATTPTAALEADADRTALAAILRLFGRGGAAAAAPSLGSGLRLSRCGEAATQRGIHVDETLGSCGSSPSLAGLPDLTSSSSSSREDIIANLETMDAGGVYVFFGHGLQRGLGGPFVGVQSADDETVSGDDIETALSADESAPTMVVLGACGSAALLQNVADGGVPVAVGFSESLSNALAATAVTLFMEELNAGKTFNEARQAVQDLIDRQPAILSGIMNRIEIRFADGYNGGMTLAEARAQHRSP